MNMQTTSPSQTILEETQPLRSQLLAHTIYDRIESINDLKVFMEHHVFAVCDFMWLLKRLQRELCGSDHPWTPPADGKLSRFINEIVLGEECDEDGEGGYASHFELYLKAMRDVGADTSSIEGFIDLLRRSNSVEAALKQIDAPESVRAFVLFNHELATSGTAGEVASAFCFGREDIIPDMFQRLLDGFDESGLNFPGLRHYIERHIELDGDEHRPIALAMVDRLCSDADGTTIGSSAAAANEAANESIKARIRLWDGILQELNNRTVS